MNRSPHTAGTAAKSAMLMLSFTTDLDGDPGGTHASAGSPTGFDDSSGKLDAR